MSIRLGIVTASAPHESGSWSSEATDAKVYNSFFAKMKRALRDKAEGVAGETPVRSPVRFDRPLFSGRGSKVHAV